MDEKKLAERIKNSPELSALGDDIAEEIAFYSDNNVAIDPLIIIMIISIIVQIILHCRKNRSDEQIADDIRNLRMLSPTRLLLLRRRLNKLWKDKLGGDTAPSSAKNPILAAVYSVSDKLNDEDVQILFQLASEESV